MRVYFHIDEFARDSVVAAALKKEFKKYKVDLEYGARYISDKVLWNYLAAFDAVIMPRPFFFKTEKKRSEGPYFFCLATESVGKQMSEPRFATFGVLGPNYNSENADALKVDRFFLWGQIGLDAVKASAPEYISACEIVGHPRYSSECFKKNILKNKVSAASKPLRVGLVTRFSVLNDFAARSPINSVSKYITDPATEVYLGDSGETIGSFRPEPELDIYSEAIESKVLCDILRESASRESNIEYVLRVHPREREETWNQVIEKCRNEGINVHLADRSLPFAHWAGSLDYLVGTPTTTFYEAFLIGVTPISTHRIDARRASLPLFLCEDETPIMDHVFCPQSLDEFFSYIEENRRLSMTHEVESILGYECGYPHHTESLAKVASSVLTILSTEPRKSSWLEWRRYKLRIRLLTLKLNILSVMRIYNLQSSSFLLTKKVRKKIDSFVGL